MNLKNMKQSETTEQIKLFNWAKVHEDFIPELKLLHHVPNEGRRTNGPVLKAEGMKAGVPDISLPVAKMGFHGLYIEMKFRFGKATKQQKEFMKLLRQQGYKTAVAYSTEEAQRILRHYLARANNFDLINCEEAVKCFDKCEGIKEDWTPCKKCKYFTEYQERG